mmetsp:Transcript_15856/g.32242  ORF Transcript_15856/g.32242 Transcript_15856/m.32242 type:complete len:182 (-) Transcript_15856:172-717(-)
MEAARGGSRPTGKLLGAAMRGDLSAVKKYLMVESEHIRDPEGPNDFRPIALVMGACGGHVEVVQYMVEQAKADVESTDWYGYTALARGASLGNLEVVRYLVEHAKANLETTNKNGETAADLARMWSHTDTLECIQEHRERILIERTQSTTRTLGRDLESLHMLHPMILTCTYGQEISSCDG